MLLLAAVCQRVPDGETCSRGSLRLIAVFYFSSFERDFFFFNVQLKCTLSTVAFSA